MKMMTTPRLLLGLLCLMVLSMFAPSSATAGDGPIRRFVRGEPAFPRLHYAVTHPLHPFGWRYEPALGGYVQDNVVMQSSYSTPGCANGKCLVTPASPGPADTLVRPTFER